MNKLKEKNRKEERRAKRTRAKIFGTASRPRLSVFRSNRYTYAQLIDDENGKTLVSASTKELSAAAQKKPKAEQAHALGELLAKKAAEAGVKNAVFDRRGYQYHGRVKALAEGARTKDLHI